MAKFVIGIYEGLLVIVLEGNFHGRIQILRARFKFFFLKFFFVPLTSRAVVKIIFISVQGSLVFLRYRHGYSEKKRILRLGSQNFLFQIYIL